MKRARKIALISVHDYPSSDYSAHWAIQVDGDDVEGWRWAAQILSNDGPVGWLWKGTVTTTRPPEPEPVYPTLSPMKEADYKRLSGRQQAEWRARQDAWRAQCAEVYEKHPKPVFVLHEALDACKTRDEADTAAQVWVLKSIKQYRRLELPTLTDAEIEALRVEYDAARARREFGRCDQIAGRLRSRGVEITPPVEAKNTTPSSTHRQKGFALGLGPAWVLGTALVGLLGRALDLILMTIAYSTTIRNERLTRVQVNIDLGAGAGLFRIYDGSRPATCGAATTKLAELTFTDPCAGAAAAGVLTFSAITSDASADATGTATWFRAVDSTGTCCVDGAVGTAGSDLNLNSTSITVAVQVSVSSMVITGGNP